MEETITNRVAKSPLVTIDLGDYYPDVQRGELDIAPWLYEGLILREGEFRKAVEEHDWSQYQDTHLALYCSEDAIIPQWAYMLLSSRLQPHAAQLYFGTQELREAQLWRLKLEKELDPEDFRAKPVIIKGCTDRPVSPQAYLTAVQLLQPVVKSILFGEACSTVPVYKKSRPKRS